MPDEPHHTPPQPFPLPTPGITHLTLPWTRWAVAAADAARLDTFAADILRTVALNADGGWTSYLTPAPELMNAEHAKVAEVLCSLEDAGLVTRLERGGHWPGSHEPDEPAGCTRGVLRGFRRVLIEGFAVPDYDGWVHVHRNEIAATLHRADSVNVPPPSDILDILVGYLEQDGWIEWSGDDCWRFTVRGLGEIGPM